MAFDPVGRLHGVLPQGSPLPESSWRLRHRVILCVLVLHAVGVLCFGLVRGYAYPARMTRVGLAH